MKPFPMNDGDSPPSPEEQQAVRESMRALESGGGGLSGNTLFEEDFAAKHGIRFRSDPPDMLTFEYGSDGEVIVGVRIPQNEGGDAGVAQDGETPIDEKQESDHPFAIKVEVTGKAGNGDWSTVALKVVSGTYQTFGGTAFNCNDIAFPDLAYDETITKGINGEFTGYVYIYIPLVADGAGVAIANSSTKVKAVTGAEIRLRSVPAVVWPQAVKVAGGVATAVLIGTWSVQRVNISAGIPTYELRVQIDQKVTDNIVLGDPDKDDEIYGDNARTFFVTAGTGSSVNISPGAINSIVCSTTTLAVTDGQSIYIDQTVDGDGNTTAVSCAAGGSVPDNTETNGYTLLATVAVSSGVVTVTPYAWDYSQSQVCGTAGESTVFNWW